MAKKNAFTLIELLVVIAIISILSSIVLVSLSEARNKARDARVISAINQFRTKAVLIYDSNGDYTDLDCAIDDAQPAGSRCVCGDTDIDILCEDIIANDNQTPGDNLVIYSESGGQFYCARVHLQGSGQYWCVDSDLRSSQFLNANQCDPSCEFDMIPHNCYCAEGGAD